MMVSRRSEARRGDKRREEGEKSKKSLRYIEENRRERLEIKMINTRKLSTPTRVRSKEGVLL
jgi:hypothetical protein